MSEEKSQAVGKRLVAIELFLLSSHSLKFRLRHKDNKFYLYLY